MDDPSLAQAEASLLPDPAGSLDERLLQRPPQRTAFHALSTKLRASRHSDGAGALDEHLVLEPLDDSRRGSARPEGACRGSSVILTLIALSNFGPSAVYGIQVSWATSS
jgi:hypothetical protein